MSSIRTLAMNDVEAGIERGIPLKTLSQIRDVEIEGSHSVPAAYHNITSSHTAEAAEQYTLNDPMPVEPTAGPSHDTVSSNALVAHTNDGNDTAKSNDGTEPVRSITMDFGHEDASDQRPVQRLHWPSFFRCRSMSQRGDHDLESGDTTTGRCYNYSCKSWVVAIATAAGAIAAITATIAGLVKHNQSQA